MEIFAETQPNSSERFFRNQHEYLNEHIQHLQDQTFKKNL